jgi:hypothetical protein
MAASASQVHQDFGDAAVAGAMAIVQGGERGIAVL